MNTVLLFGQSKELKTKYISLHKEVLLYDNIIEHFTEDGNYQAGKAFVEERLQPNTLPYYFAKALEKCTFDG